jgi:hypothetical protein
MGRASAQHGRDNAHLVPLFREPRFTELGNSVTTGVQGATKRIRTRLGETTERVPCKHASRIVEMFYLPSDVEQSQDSINVTGDNFA